MSRPRPYERSLFRLGLLVVASTFVAACAGEEPITTLESVAVVDVTAAAGGAGEEPITTLESVAVVDVTAAAGGAGEEPITTPEATSFVDVTAAAGVDAYHWAHGGSAVEMGCAELMAGGGAVADYDDDGWLDLFVARIGAPDILYRNLGDGTFIDVAAEAGLDFAGSSNAAAWADVDGDADLDLLVTTLRHEPSRLYINDGSGRFTEEAEQRGCVYAFRRVR